MAADWSHDLSSFDAARTFQLEKVWAVQDRDFGRSAAFSQTAARPGQQAHRVRAGQVLGGGEPATVRVAAQAVEPREKRLARGRRASQRFGDTISQDVFEQRQGFVTEANTSEIRRRIVRIVVRLESEVSADLTNMDLAPLLAAFAPNLSSSVAGNIGGKLRVAGPTVNDKGEATINGLRGSLSLASISLEVSGRQGS